MSLAYLMPAALRFATAFPIRRLLTNAVSATAREGRDIYLCRGWFNFPFGSQFAEHLLRSGNRPYLVHYGGDLVDRAFRSWKAGLATVARNILSDPEGPAFQSVIVGHSQGGLVVAGLAAIARSSDLQKIWKSVPQLQISGLSVRDLERLKLLLIERKVRFVSMATPFRGIEPRSPLATIASLQGSFPAGNPLLDTRGDQVLGFFEATGLRAAETMDGNLYGLCETINGPQRPFTLAVRTAMMLGAKVLFNQSPRAGRHDCLLSEESMHLGILREVVLPDTDHWMIAKTREGAEGLLRVIRSF